MFHYFFNCLERSWYFPSFQFLWSALVYRTVKSIISYFLVPLLITIKSGLRVSMTCLDWEIVTKYIIIIYKFIIITFCHTRLIFEDTGSITLSDNTFFKTCANSWFFDNSKLIWYPPAVVNEVSFNGIDSNAAISTEINLTFPSCNSNNLAISTFKSE